MNSAGGGAAIGALRFTGSPPAPREECCEHLRIDLIGDELHRAVAERGASAALANVAEARLGIIGVERKIVGLGPFDSSCRIGLDEEYRIASAVSDCLKRFAFLSSVDRVIRSDDGENICLARFQRYAGRLVHFGHLRDERLVVLAIPWLVEFELLIELLSAFDKRQ